MYKFSVVTHCAFVSPQYISCYTNTSTIIQWQQQAGLCHVKWHVILGHVISHGSVTAWLQVSGSPTLLTRLRWEGNREYSRLHVISSLSYQVSLCSSCSLQLLEGLSCCTSYTISWLSMIQASWNSLFDFEHHLLFLLNLNEHDSFSRFKNIFYFMTDW